jgi:hypothetical protein
MADRALLRQAADCYLAVGDKVSAARCMRDAGSTEQAAALYVELGMFRDAAAAYLDRAADVAGWLLAHQLNDSAAARDVVARHAPADLDSDRSALDRLRDLDEQVAQAREARKQAINEHDFEAAAEHLHREQQYLARRSADSRDQNERLRWLLVISRCDVIDGAPPAGVVRVLQTAQRYLLAWPHPGAEPIERWAVDVAAAIRRFDQVALIFAASVRGGHVGAADRWQQWSSTVLRVELTLPREES